MSAATELKIFNYSNYKDFLRARIQASKQVRGYQGLLGNAAGCQRSFISRVLNEELHLSFEHASGIADFWALDAAESAYFLDLLALARAGTKSLRKKIEVRVEKQRQQWGDLSARIKAESIPTSAQDLYYSAWYWSTLHVLSSIPEFRRAEAMARKLELPLAFVEYCLKSLKGAGLVKESEGNWSPNAGSIHLPKDSPLIWSHHFSWLQQVMKDVSQPKEHSVHYTAVHALSVKDRLKLSQILKGYIEGLHETIEPSVSEDLMCLSLHVFSP